MAVPAIYQFVNFLTGTPTAIDDAIISALTAVVNTSLANALASEMAVLFTPPSNSSLATAFTSEVAAVLASVSNTSLNTALSTGMSNTLTAPGASLVTALQSNGVSYIGPGGRLTFATATPQMANVAGATSHFWTPFNGQIMPIWNGSRFIPTDIGGELSQLATDATKSPAAVVASTLYDIFIWSDAGVLRATRGPAWSNSGAGTGSRGAGAGTTEISLVKGYYTNKNSITNGPAAGFGTYVGTILSDATSTFTSTVTGAASGGAVIVLAIYNMYNRLYIVGQSIDNGASYTYSTATIRVCRGSATNKISVVDGLGDCYQQIGFSLNSQSPATLNAFIANGIGFNSTTVFNNGQTRTQLGAATVLIVSVNTAYSKNAGIGLNTFTPLEAGDGVNLMTINSNSTVIVLNLATKV